MPDHSFSHPIQRYTVGGQTVQRINVVAVVFGPRSRNLLNFVFDTGSSVTAIPEDVASELGLPIDRHTGPQLRAGVGQFVGWADAVLMFPRLPNLTFGTKLAVIRGLPRPMLGFADVVQNFAVAIDPDAAGGGAVVFRLRDSHRGGPVPPANPTRSPDESNDWRELGEAIAAAATPDRTQVAREQDQLLADEYSGQYVALRDIWDGDTFVRRHILAHGRSLREVHGQLSGLSDQEVAAVRVTYCDEPDRPVVGGWWPKVVSPPGGRSGQEA